MKVALTKLYLMAAMTWMFGVTVRAFLRETSAQYVRGLVGIWKI